MNPNLLAAYLVPDGTFDPLRLALAFAAHAKKYGARFLTYHEAEGLVLDGKGNVVGVRAWDRTSDKHIEMKADMVINATGAWAGKIAEFAGLDVPITPTPGIMVAYDQRLVNRVVNRLCPPDDGDILLPQRRMVVIGTTSFEVEDVDYIPVFEDQVKMMRERAIELVPSVEKTSMRGAYMAARPLVGKGQSGRSLARTFKCFDHQETDGVGGFVTITGGKATTCRIMAEKTVDVVCSKLTIKSECQTKEIPLAPYYEYYSI
jgi:glycerol-3-phosphate dehydrogenase